MKLLTNLCHAQEHGYALDWTAQVITVSAEADPILPVYMPIEHTARVHADQGIAQIQCPKVAEVQQVSMCQFESLIWVNYSWALVPWLVDRVILSGESVRVWAPQYSNFGLKWSPDFLNAKIQLLHPTNKSLVRYLAAVLQHSTLLLPGGWWMSCGPPCSNNFLWLQRCTNIWERKDAPTSLAVLPAAT